MKTSLCVLFACGLASFAQAEFRTWTRGDGKTAELDLVSVTDADGEKSGEFKTRNGRGVTLKASVLSEADAKLLAEWKSTETEEDASPVSVFDEVLGGNLVMLKGKSLKTFKDLKKPVKYYVFYYTASWCGPCHEFTPSLVKFYEKHKNDNFEIILITSDSDEEAMEEYAAELKMPWPQLELKKAEGFKKNFKHGVNGIPSVIVCELDGKKLGNFRDLAALEKLVK